MVAVVASLAVAVLVVGSNLLLRTSLRDDADRVLAARASAALNGVDVEDGRVAPSEAPDEGVAESGVWIYDGTTRVEAPAEGDRASDLADAMARGIEPDYTELKAEDLRLHAAAITDGGNRVGAVVVSLNIEPYERSANRALIASLILGLAMLGLIVLLTRVVVNRALKPVARMTSEAAEWSENDLEHRFNLGPPRDELTLLASTFDTMLARLAENLRREQRLTAEISHELRTPLAAIAAEAELALRRERNDEEYVRALEGIQRRARQLAEIIETLMIAARSESLLSRDVSPANEAAQRAIESLDLGGEAGAVDLKPAPSNPMIQAGLAAASQVIAPLLNNAYRHGAVPIEVVVSTRGERVEFEIRDRGPGIPAEDLERVFDPGVRGVGSPDDADSTGAGLGLALARRLARALGGDIVAVAGDGGVMRVSLPLVRR